MAEARSIGKTVLVIFATFIGISIGVGFVQAITGHADNTGNTNISDQAIRNTARNAFISSCRDTGGAGVSADECGCAFDHLSDYYANQGNPKWYEDQALVGRITSEGYNQSETDSFVACVAGSY